MYSAFSMAGRVRRSWYSKARKYNAEHRAHDLIHWGLKFIEAGIRWLPADFPVELRVWDERSQTASIIPISKELNREPFVSNRSDDGTPKLVICFSAEKRSSVRKGRPNLTAVDGGVQS